MNNRIHWNAIELLKLKQHIEQNPGKPLLQQVQEAQTACLAKERHRSIVNYSGASLAWKRMQEAAKTQVPASEIMAAPATAMPVIHAIPSTTAMQISVDQLAKVLLGLRAAGITVI